MQIIENISDILHRIGIQFSFHYNQMDFLFLSLNGSNRRIINTIRNLQGLKLSVEYGTDIAFDSTLVSDYRSANSGWRNNLGDDNGFSGYYGNNGYNKLTTFYSVIPDVKRINIKGYGFEICSANYDLIACRTSLLNSEKLADIHDLCGKIFKGLVLKNTEDNDVEYMWRSDEEIDEQQSADEELNDTPSIGQARRNLLLEPENV